MEIHSSLFRLLLLVVHVQAIPPQFHALHSNRNSGMGGSSDLWAMDSSSNRKTPTTTSVPLICLMEWNSPKCREHAFNVPAPKFAPNFKFPKPPEATNLEDDTGFFTPILPKSLDSEQQQSSERNNRIRHSKTTKPTATTSHLITSTTTTTTERARQVSLLSTTTQSASLLAVRPTTPFGPDLVMTTTKMPAATGDFPRTALILFASISVIVIIAVVVFCVFRCRQNGPPHDSYPMAYNGKGAGITAMGGTGTLGSNHGYLPIPSEMSPPVQHNTQFATLAGRQVCYDTMNGATTLPAVLRNGSQNGGPATNTYQPLPTGQVIVNANGQSRPANGHASNGMANGGSRTLGSKKEFKEWYV